MKKIAILLAFLMVFATSVDAQRHKRSKKKTAKTTQTTKQATQTTTTAPKEDPEELFFMANKYLSGVGVPEDKAKAVELMKRAADLGHENAQKELQGIELCEQALLRLDEKDRQQAFNILNEAEKNGSFYAARLMGMGYDRGVFDTEGKRSKSYNVGTGLLGALASAAITETVRGGAEKRDHETAVYIYYKKAAERGDLYSQKIMGSCYLTGDVVSVDYAQAAHWYEGPAKAGDPHALFALGAMYYNGKGVTEDKEKGVQMMRQAADFGNEEAKKKLIELGL